jgi:hypothetical protein
VNEVNHDRVDALEQHLITRGHDVTDVAVAFSEYLLILLSDHRVALNPQARVDIEHSLKRSAKLSAGVIGAEEKRQLRRKMGGIEITFRESDGPTAAFGRSAMNCLFDEGDWQEDNDGDATPLFYYLHCLERALPDIADDFFNYFSNRFGIDVV